MQILYDEKLEEPPPADRLRAMIRALASGIEIDAVMRTEIIDALKRHEVRRSNDRVRSTRGNGIAHTTLYAAVIAKELVDHHGAPVGVAIRAAEESVRWQMGFEPRRGAIDVADEAKIRRTYEKINKSVDGYLPMKGGKFKVTNVTGAWIEDAVARLTGNAATGDTPEGINLIVDRQGYEGVAFIRSSVNMAGATGAIVLLTNHSE